MLDDADMIDCEESAREVAARFVRLEDRCALDFRAMSLDDPGIGMGGLVMLDGEPVRSLSVVIPSNESVVLLSRFEDEGVEPPELWLRNRRPNSVLYMLSHDVLRQESPGCATWMRSYLLLCKLDWLVGRDGGATAMEGRVESS